MENQMNDYDNELRQYRRKKAAALIVLAVLIFAFALTSMMLLSDSGPEKNIQNNKASIENSPSSDAHIVPGITERKEISNG
jgi:hypothetical protein